jgi:hypothetical protein
MQPSYETTVYGVYSNYHYRLKPTVIRTWNYHYSYYKRLWPNVKPTLTAWNGVPAFKTQKMLAGRTVVLDNIDNVYPDFNVYGLYAARDVYGIKGGAAQFHHRDGYNILYGDNHAAWYGDPNKVIAYAFGGGHNGYWGPSATFDPEKCEPANLTVPGGGQQVGDGDTQNPPFSCSQVVWTLFDQAAGIDIP